jgi:hypothetical protein
VPVRWVPDGRKTEPKDNGACDDEWTSEGWHRSFGYLYGAAVTAL